MARASRRLPNFEPPPVSEVVLGVQFESLKAFRIVHIGMLWQEFREKFPLTEEHAPLEPVIERFGINHAVGKVSLQILDAPPIPRCWFLNAAGADLIQIQSDRFLRNWRKVEEDSEYP